MKKQRILLLDEKVEAALLMICDVALKFAGVHMATVVADVATAIRDRSEDSLDEDW